MIESKEIMEKQKYTEASSWAADEEKAQKWGKTWYFLNKELELAAM